MSGENSSFNGQLIVSGSHLSFRKAPLDVLQAAVKLQGNEIQVTNAEFTHGDDYLRADGVVNILGEKRYWGEVKASIADLSLYASFLQPPIAPEAFGGGLMLDWQGDGAQSAHSGAFTVKLNRIRPLVSGSSDASWAPIDLNAEATYSPQSIFFSNLVLGNGQTTLASRVVATPRSLTFQGLKLTHGKSTWLTGDAQVPLNVWAAWENPATAAWWNFDSPCKLNVALSRLSVRDTLFLSARQQGFEGELTGNIHSDGTLAKLTGSGHLTVKNAGGTIPAGTLKDCNATLDLKGSTLSATGAAGNWDGIAWTGSGAVTAPDVRAPLLDLATRIPSLRLPLGAGLSAASALAISGSAQLQMLQVDRTASLRSLVSNGGLGLDGSLPAPSLPGPKAWKLNLHAGGSAALKLANTTGIIIPDVMLTGSLSHPAISGSVTVKGLSLSERMAIGDSADFMTISDATFFLNPADPAGTALTMHASGMVEYQPFEGYLYGTLADKHFTWPPEITTALAGAVDVTSPPFKALQPFAVDTGVAPVTGASVWPAPAKP